MRKKFLFLVALDGRTVNGVYRIECFTYVLNIFSPPLLFYNLELEPSVTTLNLHKRTVRGLQVTHIPNMGIDPRVTLKELMV